MMEIMHWTLVGAGVAAAAAGAGWLLVLPHDRGWKPLNDRMADQVSLSAALEKKCTTTMG